MPGNPTTIEGLRADKAADQIGSISYKTDELENIFYGNKPVGIPYWSLAKLKECHTKLGKLIERAEASAAEFDALVEKWRAAS
jgi:hypothetical protein